MATAIAKSLCSSATMALARYPLAIMAISTAAIALPVWAFVAFFPGWPHNERPAHSVVAAKIDAKRIDGQLASMRDVRRRFQSADTLAKRAALQAEYQRAVRDGVALLSQFRESVPKLGGQTLERSVELSDEPDVVEHIVDLMELTMRMQAEQLAIRPPSNQKPIDESTPIAGIGPTSGCHGPGAHLTRLNS